MAAFAFFKTMPFAGHIKKDMPFKGATKTAQAALSLCCFLFPKLPPPTRAPGARFGLCMLTMYDNLNEN